ncbi:UDP-N-acetylmuramate dehydrogenase [Pendulispora albinea]|uniref:UDP-N-acetylenolpyruvoylglucosamine reductase n=1 Tax=Pendulispora albinea TaxID=2741071 RepID=A0ABZ2LMP4_9BACT
MRQEQNVPLARLTTLRLGGPAARLVEVENLDELVATVRDLDGRGEPLLVVGGGSNLVVADEGFSGTVLKLAFDAITVDERGEQLVASVDGGADWDAFVARAVGEGYRGVECLSGIPGSVGATPMQNVGAYGQEVSETIARLRVLDRATGALAWIDRADCAFAYRSSRFRGQTRYIIVQVVFALTRATDSAPIRYAELARALGIRDGERAPLRDVRETVLRLRRAKGMVIDSSDPESVSAGSFFVNPVVDASTLAAIERLHAGTVVSTGTGDSAGAAGTVPRFSTADGRFKVPAAWLIEHAGFTKGHRRGPVGISTKHALALVHRGGGTTRDLLALARDVRNAVHTRFGVELSAEPIMVGCAL